MKTAPRHTRRALASSALLRQAQAHVEKYGPAFPRTAASPTTRVEQYLLTVPVIHRVRVTDAIKHHLRILAKARAKADAKRLLSGDARDVADAKFVMERSRKMRMVLRLPSKAGVSDE